MANSPVQLPCANIFEPSNGEVVEHRMASLPKSAPRHSNFFTGLEPEYRPGISGT